MTPVDRLVDGCRRRPLVVDAVLALLVLAIGVAEARSSHTVRAHWDGATLAVLGCSAPIVLRRRYPVPAAATTAVVAAVTEALIGGAALEVPVLVMAYSVVVYGPRWAGALMAVVMLVGGVIPFVAFAGSEPGMLAVTAVISLLVAACTWLAGALRRAGRRSTEALRERARLLEDGRRQEVRLELLAERSRISREVHDVVAHSLSGIIAQADGGQFAATRDPQRAVEVLAGIASAGRDALSEVRGLLAMLRDTVTPGDAEHVTPGLTDVPALVERVRSGGLPVTLEVTGEPYEVPTATGLTAYRVVQEALTNVVKHAGRDVRTRVRLGWGGDELAVSVRDDGGRGTARTPPSGGHGLLGMRERAALYGGAVETGPHPDGGFEVRVRLPRPVHAEGAP